MKFGGERRAMGRRYQRDTVHRAASRLDHRRSVARQGLSARSRPHATFRHDQRNIAARRG